MHIYNERERPLYNELSVVIMTPCGSGYVSIDFARSLANMIAYSWKQGLKIYQMATTSRTVVDWARNDLARNAKNYLCEYTGEKFTHLLWLDDDILFNPDLACRLASYSGPEFERERPRSFDMVSALYFGRKDKPLPLVFVRNREKPEEDKYYHHQMAAIPDALFEVDAVGFGALLMRRDVLDRVPEPWFTIDWQAGEDIAFCVKAKEHGIKIWCDGGYSVGHIGDPRVIDRGDFEAYMAQNEDMNIFETTVSGVTNAK